MALEKKMTIIFVRTMGFGVDTGVNTYCQQLIKHFEERVDSIFNFVILTINYNSLTEFSVEKINGLKHINVPKPIFPLRKINNEGELLIFGGIIAKLVMPHIEKTGEIIIHINWIDHGLLISKLKSGLNAKVILTRHCIPWKSFVHSNYNVFYELTSRQKKTVEIGDFDFESKNYSHVDKFITVTDCSQEDLVSNFAIEPANIKRIYNGVSAVYEKPLPTKNALRNKYNFDKNEKLLIYIGRREKNVGLTWLLEAFNSIVLEEKIPLRLIIVGNVDIKEIRSYDIRTASRIWSTGYIENSNLLELYKLSDIGIVPSLYEQCSYVAIEMMLSGLILLCSNVDGLGEMINNHENGLTFNISFDKDKMQSSAKEIKEQLLYALATRNRHVIGKIKKNAKQSILDRYNITKNINELYKVYMP